MSIRMHIRYISGSPRSGGNTDYLLNALRGELDGTLIRLSDYRVEHCRSCWKCRDGEGCGIRDDMTTRLIPMLLKSDALILGSPVFFNNVTADAKAFMDRTWCLRGQLRNNLGAAVVVGRRYGAEAAVAAINGFFLKHDMLVANRGITGAAFEKGEIRHDAEALRSVHTLATRTRELLSIVNSNSSATNMSDPDSHE